MFESKHSGCIQTKLTICQPNDQYEQEADAVADQVMRMPKSQIPTIQCKCEACEEKELQMKPIAESITPIVQKQEEEEVGMLQMKGLSGGEISRSNLQTSLQQSKGGGHGLDNATQAFMSEGIGADFSHVKVHTRDNAIQMNRQLNAKAFTNGPDIYFNQGQYNPQSSEGEHLLAHELTHVVQQEGSLKTIQREESEMTFTAAEAELALAENRTESVDHRERRMLVSVTLRRAINFLQAAIIGRLTIGPGYEFVRSERIYIGSAQDAAHPVTSERNVEGETWEERNSRLSILVAKLRELHGFIRSQPLPEQWYPDNSQGEYTANISEDPLWNDLMNFYLRYVVESEPQNPIHLANLLYINIGGFTLNSSRGVSRRSHATGINLVVPDPDNNPYNYQILSGFSPLSGLIVEVRKEEDIYFYIYRGHEIFLHGDPLSREEDTEQRRDPLIEDILQDF